jgi:hypothetical protein
MEPRLQTGRDAGGLLASDLLDAWPFVATLVDVTGLMIYFSVASTVLRGMLL